MIMSWPDVRARRMARHGLGSAGCDGVVAAARAICGAHAQIMSAAELSLGIRCPGTSRSDVRAALWTDQTLVKTYGPRGTVHLLPAEDLPWWLAALSAVPHQVAVPDTMAMSKDQTEAVITAIGDAVADAGDRGLTIAELSEQVPARAGSWAGDLVMPAFQQMWPRWRQSLGAAAHRGAVIFGPDRGRQVTYRSPADLLSVRPAPSESKALAWLLRGYLHSYGPARPRDFAKWLAGPVRWAEQLFGKLASEFTEVEFAEAEAYVVRRDTKMSADRADSVRLLPYFDSFVVGSHPRDLLFPGKAAERALSPSGQAGNYPTLLINGEVAGVWHARRSGSTIAITVEPLRGLTTSQRAALDEEADRIGFISEAKPSLTIGTVSVGGHA
jgi:hypothetical protein